MTNERRRVRRWHDTLSPSTDEEKARTREEDLRERASDPHNDGDKHRQLR